ncbi:MAG: HNH endonuclease [Acidobacteria bacterium]|nr:HNH endonuclease [Acidobacteriota bacterium]
MKVLMSTNGYLIMVSDEDFEWANNFKWHADKGGVRGYTRYARRHLGKRRYAYMHNEIRDGRGVDHKNGDGLDNRRENLRFATISQNLANRRKRRGAVSSRHKGVYLKKASGKFAAHIRVNRRAIHLGYFTSESEAAKAYNAAAREHFGEYARLNEV